MFLLGLNPLGPTDETVSGFLDPYVERYVNAEGLKSRASVVSRVAVLKMHLGERPVRELERVDVIEDFKSAYGKDRKLSSVNRTLGVLRHAINWGMGRSPAVFQRSPFSRFGVKIKTKAETRRDRRVLPDEEQRLLSRRQRSWTALTTYTPVLGCETGSSVRWKQAVVGGRCRSSATGTSSGTRIKS